MSNLNEILQDWLLAQVLANMLRAFWLNEFWLSYGPLKKMFCLQFTTEINESQKLVWTTPPKVLMQFEWNLTGLITGSRGDTCDH